MGQPGSTVFLGRMAAIDIGSSAARIAIAQAGTPGGPQVLWQHRYPVRLGQDAFAGAGTGAISAACEAELVAAAHAMRGQMAAYGVLRARAVATSALRDAANGVQVSVHVGTALGVPLEIISGAEEAALAREALLAAFAAHRVPIDEHAVLLDLGGGSTELVPLAGAPPVSLPLGTVRLLASEPTCSAALGAGAVAALRTKVTAQVFALAHAAHFAPPKAATIIGSGGNLHALAKAAPAHHGPKGAPFAVIDLAALRALLPEVAAKTVRARARSYGLQPERADLFLPALLALDALGQLLAAPQVLVPGTGLRDAMLLRLADVC